MVSTNPAVVVSAKRTRDIQSEVKKVFIPFPKQSQDIAKCKRGGLFAGILYRE